MKKLFKKVVIFLLAATMSFAFGISAFAAQGDYQHSDEYKTSKFYTALQSYKLTGDTRKDLAGIAQTQVGYHEGDGEADMHGNKTSGSANFVEYNRLFGKVNGTYGYEWSVSFIIWCARHAGITEAELENDINVKNLVGNFSSTGRFYQKETGYTPKEGDLVFFLGSSTGPTRAGIVTSFKDNKINTVEGDFGEAVKQRSYAPGDDTIYGYATIKQDASEFFVTQSTDLFLPTGEYFTTVPAGTILKATAFDGRKVQITYNETVARADITFLFPSDSFSFTVSYDSGEGRGAPKDQSTRPGEELKLSDKAPTFKGHTFLGWATEDGGKVVYQPGDKYAGSESVVLHAVWQANKYTVKFVNPDGSVIINLRQKKTGVWVSIPAKDELKRILEKYSYRLPKVPDKSINLCIKEVARLSGVDSPVTIETTSGGRTSIQTHPKYALIHTHTARRTGATLMYLAGMAMSSEAGMDVFNLCSVTGHSSIAMLKKYIKADKIERARTISSDAAFTKW